MNREEFESLNSEEQEKVFHKSPYKERSDLLFSAHDPQKIAKSLTHEEFYLLTREMDIDEKAVVLRYATIPQLFFLSDIDCWSHDRLEGDKFLDWLESLQQADEKRLLAWLVEMDYETVVTGLKKIIHVTKPTWEYAADETLGDTTYFTLDEQYHVHCKEENLETAKRVIQVLFEKARGRYVAILEGILSELEYECEEEAFRKREMRLAERGFPETERANAIYQPITLKEFEAFPIKEEGVTSQILRRDGKEMPGYMLLWSEKRLFLDEVLLLFREDEARNQALQDELAWLSNKIIASKGIDLASEERVREGIERARTYVSLGLEDLSGKDLHKAQQLLCERWLEVIFRWGMTQVLHIRARATHLIDVDWSGNTNEFLRFLRRPYDLIFKGLLQSVPLYYDVLLEEKSDALRDFSTGEEIHRTQTTVDQIVELHQWLRQSKLNLPKTFGNLMEDDELHLYSLLGTFFVQHTLNKKLSLSPVSMAEVEEFVEKAFQPNGKQRVLRAELKQSWFETAFGSHGEDFRSLLGLVHSELEEEFGRLDMENALDKRFLSSVWIQS